MYTPEIHMDFERCQDLSELPWFEGAATWPAGEKLNDMTASTDLDTYGPAPMFTMQPPYEADYNINIGKQSYYNNNNLSRTDSLEEIKLLAVAAPMEVVPMQRREAMEVQNIVKMEREEFDLGREEEVSVKEDPDDFFNPAQDDIALMDSQELLQELGDGDLINFIMSDPPTTPQEMPKLEPITPAPVPPPVATPVAPKAPQLQPQQPPPPANREKAVRETYLAIPRELAGNSSDDKKIPKMLILKTPQTSSFPNTSDLAMSIAERIKTVGKRQRTRRYSSVSEEDNDDEKDEDFFEETPVPTKRSRRVSTTSSMGSSTDRYRELRDKNNEASRRSRQHRKAKERDMMDTLNDTERRNTELKARSDELEKLVNSLRKILLQIVLKRQTER